MDDVLHGRYVRETDAWNADRVIAELADAWLDAQGADHSLYRDAADWADDAGYGLSREGRCPVLDATTLPPQYRMQEDAVTVTGDQVAVRYRVHHRQGEIAAQPRPADPFVSLGDGDDLSDRDDLLLHHVTAYFDEDTVLAGSPEN